MQVYGLVSPPVRWHHRSKRLNEAGMAIGPNEGKTQRRPMSEGVFRPQLADGNISLEKLGARFCLSLPLLLFFPLAVVHLVPRDSHQTLSDHRSIFIEIDRVEFLVVCVSKCVIS
jgi:hypothetical protein